MRAKLLLGVGCLACWFGTVSNLALAGMDEGRARFVPWSGSFWPIQQGLLIRGPLTRYDRITNHRAAAWEWQKHRPSPEVPKWFGYCHGWAAAAVLEREPLRPRVVRAWDGAPVPLGIGDQKGLLTACHTQDVAHQYGKRNTGTSGDTSAGFAPLQLWHVLKLYIQQQRVPLLVNIDPGPQVWNYPVYAYRVVYGPTGRGDEQQAAMSIWMADDAVLPDFRGTKVAKQTYYFSFRLQQGAADVDSGRWIGPSIKYHPGFAWYPYLVMAENPEVRYLEVKGLVDASGRGPSDEASAGSFDPDNPTPPESEASETPARPARLYALSPVEMLALVTNRTSSFSLDVMVNKFSGGEYAPGEKFTISGASARAGFLYLFYLDSHARLGLLYPRAGQDNRVPAQSRFVLPGADDKFVFRTAFPAGTHRIKAVVTTVPLVFTGLAPPGMGGDQPGRPQNFYLPAGQQELFQEVMRRYQSHRPAPPNELGNASPRRFLGEFAQAETVFYVRPAARHEAERRE